jgi:hypothetical protein
MYSVNREWDRLDVCVVGRSYPTTFYDWIPNHNVRETMQAMAQATCSGLEHLANILEQHGVTVLRPNIPSEANPEHFPLPPQQPRDHMFMAGNVFCYNDTYWQRYYQNVKLPHWFDYDDLDQFLAMAPASQIAELEARGGLDDEIRYIRKFGSAYGHVVDHVKQQGNLVHNLDWADGGQIMRLDLDWIWGTNNHTDLVNAQRYQQRWPNIQHHVVNSAGHIDGIFCVPKPGVLIAVDEPDCHIDYESIVPGWHIYRLAGSSLMRDLARGSEMQQFVQRTQGRWWLPGAEKDAKMTAYIENQFKHWFGHSWESSFDVNILSIDQHNVITTSADAQFLDILAKHDITAHVLDQHFSTMYFWDGGIHCMTAELNRVAA